MFALLLFSDAVTGKALGLLDLDVMVDGKIGAVESRWTCVLLRYAP